MKNHLAVSFLLGILLSCGKSPQSAKRDTANPSVPNLGNKKQPTPAVPTPVPSPLPPDPMRWFQDLGGLKQLPSFQVTELEKQVGWGQITIGGGGYVTGLYVHPNQPTKPWIRTDISGVLKWDPDLKKWNKKFKGLLLSRPEHYGVESLALDPQDPNVIYAAVGKYTASWAGLGALVKSTDGGNTWQTLSNAPSLRMGGNEFLRYGGEGLVVDSLNRNTLLFAPRSNANAAPALLQPQLLRSTDGGETWISLTVDGTQMGDFGVTSVVPAGDAAGHFFAASYGHGIFETTNNGDTWTNIGGNNSFVHRMHVTGKAVWVAGRSNDPDNTSILKPALTKYCFGLDSQCASVGWTDLSVPHVVQLNEGLIAVAVDPTDSQNVVVARSSATHSRSTGLLSTLLRSMDGGTTWKSYHPHLQFQHGWLVDTERYADNVSQILFLQDGSFWVADWFGTWFHQKQSNQFSIAKQQVAGLENTVVFDLVPGTDLAKLDQGGVQLEVLSGLADVDGFPHLRGNAFPPTKHLMESGYNAQATLSFAQSVENSSVMFRVSGNMWTHSGYGNFPVLKSSNAGLTWSELRMPNDPAKGPPADVWDESVRVRAARVAVADKMGQKLAVQSFGAGVWTSADQGLSWVKNNQIPAWNPPANFFSFARNLFADPLEPETVYLYDDASGESKGTLWRSQNSGISFVKIQNGSNGSSQLPHNSRAQLSGGLRSGGTASFLVLASRDALHLSVNQGQNWSQIGGFERADCVGIGAPKAAGSSDVIWVVGRRVNDGEGVFFSENEGKSWQKVPWDQTDASNEPTVITPRKDRFGVVYVGTNGSGAWRYVSP